jgi:hypothetical protein
MFKSLNTLTVIQSVPGDSSTGLRVRGTGKYLQFLSSPLRCSKSVEEG